MKVVNNGITYKVGWQYTNTVLNGWLEFLGLKPAEAKKMKGPDLNKELEKVMKLVGAKCIPPPDITECIIYDEKNEEITRAKVVRRKCEGWEEFLCSVDGRETHDPEKARIYSLTKVLQTQYPGQENKELRTAFWNAYFDRKKVLASKEVVQLT